MKPTSLAPNFVANASVKVRKALPPAHRPLPACPGARASQSDLCGCGALPSRARRARPLFLSPLLRAGRAFPQRRRARGLDWRAGRALDVLLCFLNWRLSMSVAAHVWLELGMGPPPPRRGPAGWPLRARSGCSKTCCCRSHGARAAAPSGEPALLCWPIFSGAWPSAPVLSPKVRRGARPSIPWAVGGLSALYRRCAIVRANWSRVLACACGQCRDDVYGRSVLISAGSVLVGGFVP